MSAARAPLRLLLDEDLSPRVVTANVADFERLATSREVHVGIVLLEEGDPGRDEQLAVIRDAVAAIQAEHRAGRDLVNRALRIPLDGTSVILAS